MRVAFPCKENRKKLFTLCEQPKANFPDNWSSADIDRNLNFSDEANAFLLSDYYFSVFIVENGQNVSQLNASGHLALLETIRCTFNGVPKKAEGLDWYNSPVSNSFLLKIVKKAWNKVHRHLVTIFIAATKMETVPADWREVSVTPTLKKNSSSQPSN